MIVDAGRLLSVTTQSHTAFPVYGFWPVLLLACICFIWLYLICLEDSGRLESFMPPPVEFIKLYYCFLTLFSFFTHWCVLVELITNCLPDYKCFMLLRALLKRCLQSQRDDLINRLLRRKGPKVETEQITVVFFPFCYSVTHLNVVFYRTAGWIGYGDIVETL